MQKFGWLVFLIGFMLGAIGSIPGPKERLLSTGRFFLSEQDIQNLPGFLEKCRSTNPATAHVVGALPAEMRELVLKSDIQNPPDTLKKGLIDQLNRLIGDESFSSPAFLEKLRKEEKLSVETLKLIPRIQKTRSLGAEAFRMSIQPLSTRDIKDPASLAATMLDKQNPISNALRSSFSERLAQILEGYEPSRQKEFIQELNGMLRGKPIYQENRFPVVFSAKTLALAPSLSDLDDKKERTAAEKKLVAEKTLAFNRRVIEELYPNEIGEKPVLLKKATLRLHRLALEDLFAPNLSSAFWLASSSMTVFGVIIAIAGVAFIYLVGKPKASAHESTGEATQNASGQMKGNLDMAIKALESMNFQESKEAIQAKLEKVQMDLLMPIADSRKALAEELGLARFATVFAEFANGERYVNRAWSAIVDGHLPECQNSVSIALSNLQEATQYFQRE